jgi:aryl-alcohol dehydrogenase-like predicted oxidoreductase
MGTMTLSGGYGAVPFDRAVTVLAGAIADGVTMVDTADVYGNGEELVRQALARVKGHDIEVVTKVGLLGPPGGRSTDASPMHIRMACERSLKRLGLDSIHVYLLHRVDPGIPLEDSIGAMGDLIRRGLVQRIGICTASTADFLRAHAVHPISVVQTEFSVLHQHPRHGLVPKAAELGISVMAHSPLRRGLLAKRNLSQEFTADDARAYVPYMHEDSERQLAWRFHSFAESLHAKPIELALGWLNSHGSMLVPLPGARTREQARENTQALRSQLTASEIARIDHVLARGC